eukprot:TRINITY_DN2796_c0_g1_i1.p1 TRINITY_DN2796_c0_g1~~TRINITY_DN2796_c0_g1_i1.p1  ORF type:complete len:166 (-),score=31.53 TRINITY_DN2796_c0_g1_i1:203-700(-)
MSTNSLRGGKNIYGPKTFLGNYFEQRLEPGLQEQTRMYLDQLPTKTAKQWSKTSEFHGQTFQEQMRRAIPGPESANWLQYQPMTSSVQYSTTSGAAHCHPQEQLPAFKAPHIPEEKLKPYRDTWTHGDSHRFESTYFRRGEPIPERGSSLRRVGSNISLEVTAGP